MHTHVLEVHLWFKCIVFLYKSHITVVNILIHQVLLFSYFYVTQLERQRRMKGLPLVDEKPKHISADDLGDR